MCISVLSYLSIFKRSFQNKAIVMWIILSTYHTGFDLKQETDTVIGLYVKQHVQMYSKRKLII